MNTLQRRPATAGDEAIRPFSYHASDQDLAELRQRIAAARWPDRETVGDSSQGAQQETVRKLVEHWAASYDWRNIERRINALPNHVTQIDGAEIHFLHVRSKDKGALPLLIAHGWPGTIVALMKVIGPLTDPTTHGGEASDAFHLVIPSMPGYGFSSRPTSPGWTPLRVASAYSSLMTRLGYDRWAAQGGDWGAIVVEQMALKQPAGLVGIHTNMPGAVPPDVDAALLRGDPPPEGQTDEERRACEQLASAYRHIGYAQLLGGRPQTMTYLADSPAGLAAFLIDNVPRSYELMARIIDGAPETLTIDDLLDNITLFWLTNTAVSAARLYWENTTPYFSVKGISLPVAVSAFPDELFATPRSWAEKAYTNLVHYNQLPRGGHFPAWEQPELFVQEVRAGFRTLR
jgi:pimeloyl-ACP methyl ester carboxylesterase